MTWISVNNTNDLTKLQKVVCWEDSQTLELYASSKNCSYFPDDISRSGRNNKNLHLLSECDSPAGDYIHLILIDCDQYQSSFIEEPFFIGSVDSLQRVDVSLNNKTYMRCSRLIYRFPSIDDCPHITPYLLSNLQTHPAQ